MVRVVYSPVSLTPKVEIESISCNVEVLNSMGFNVSISRDMGSLGEKEWDFDIVK